MEQMSLTKNILTLLGNNKTKVVEKDEYKFSYYNYFTDTIYLAPTIRIVNEGKFPSNLNQDSGKLVMLCHECIHSVQHKLLHILNTFFSNITIVLFIINMALTIFYQKIDSILYIGIVFTALTIICRTFLEVNAIYRSIAVARSAVENNKIGSLTVKDIEDVWKYAKKYMPVQLFMCIMDKLVIFIVTIIIT